MTCHPSETNMDAIYEEENNEILVRAVMSPREVILSEAIRLTTGDRSKDYGSPVQNHQQIADIFNAMTGHTVTAREVALFHVATKLARLRFNNTHRDSHVDAAAYIGIAFECATEGAA